MIKSLNIPKCPKNYITFFKNLISTIGKLILDGATEKCTHQFNIFETPYLKDRGLNTGTGTVPH